VFVLSRTVIGFRLVCVEVRPDVVITPFGVIIIGIIEKPQFLQDIGRKK